VQIWYFWYPDDPTFSSIDLEIIKSQIQNPKIQNRKSKNPKSKIQKSKISKSQISNLGSKISKSPEILEIHENHPKITKNRGFRGVGRVTLKNKLVKNRK
jgi:hypothetical protein